MFGETVGMTAFWLMLVVVFALAEAATVSLVSIWFAGSALVALICSILGLSVGVQVTSFIVVSIILLAFTRKIFVEKLKLGSEKTNYDTLIGKPALVVDNITPYEGGRAKVNGVEWKAIFEDSNLFANAGDEVIIEKIEGVKLVVVPKE